jgi:hypothetical protein
MTTEFDPGTDHIGQVADDARPDRHPRIDATASRPHRRYTRPRLVRIAEAGDLLEALGPAQAGYGGPP